MDATTDYRAIRERAGVSQMMAAASALTSLTTLRLFEAGGPKAISNTAIRERLVAAFESMAEAAR